MSQSLIDLSQELESILFLSFTHIVALVTGNMWPWYVCTTIPRSVFQSRTVPSFDEVKMFFPSQQNWQLVTPDW
uniref:Mitochondrial pyruvate carrier 2-like n=1 Tax=Phallusia mammillata TaxID=59560 RepID=A0A6F9DLT1_9ASCI|nr:mitochondrial pyruvate carrier 2-like [Phallusia mammillata]